jgi:DNA repair protein RecO (recombination protein O)
MIDERSTGLVVRLKPLTETSLIVHWLSADLGRLATVAKGARRPKSPFRGKLDLFYLAEFSFQRSRRSDLHTLREVNLRETYSVLRQDLSALQQASYCAILCELTTESDTPVPAVFALLKQLLEHVTQQPIQPFTVFAFEMKLLAELGLAPPLHEAKLSPGARRLLEKSLSSDWPTLPRFKPSRPQLEEMGSYLYDFLLFHLGKVPPGRAGAIHPEATFSRGTNVRQTSRP